MPFLLRPGVKLAQPVLSADGANIRYAATWIAIACLQFCQFRPFIARAQHLHRQIAPQWNGRQSARDQQSAGRTIAYLQRQCASDRQCRRGLADARFRSALKPINHGHQAKSHRDRLRHQAVEGQPQDVRSRSARSPGRRKYDGESQKVRPAPAMRMITARGKLSSTSVAASRLCLAPGRRFTARDQQHARLKNTSSFSGYVRLTVSGGDVNDLQLKSSDDARPAAGVFIDRSNVSLPANMKLITSVQQEVRVTVSNVKRRGITRRRSVLVARRAPNETNIIPLAY